jgi:hypothetical protein
VPHGEHALDPLVVLKKPVSHGVHAEAPPALKYPALQLGQEAAPAVGLAVPGLQLEHPLDPAVLVEPGEHVPQFWSFAILYFPAVQATHDVIWDGPWT